MSTTTLVSVLMPVYNAARYVAQAVESILLQSFADFELLIINDGSTDGSLAILERCAARDRRIRLISRPNTGLVVALNEMLGRAQGELIARMDADDLSLPARFEQQVTFLQQHRDVVCVGTQCEFMDEQGRIFDRSAWPTDPAEIERQHLCRGYCLLHPTWMLRRTALESVGGYSTACYPAEDNDMLLKLGEKGALSNVDEVLFKYRIGSHSVSSENRLRQWEGCNQALRDAWRRRGLSGDPPVSTSPPAGDRVGVVSGQEGRMRRGWAAWNGGYKRTARTYAWQAVWHAPLDRGAWMLAACAWLKNAETRRWFG